MSKDHPCGNNLAQNPLTPGVLTICTEKLVFFQMKYQMEWFNPVKIFCNRRNAFEGIPLFSFQVK